MEGTVASKLHESTKRTVRKNNRIRRQISDNSTLLFLPEGSRGTFSRQNLFRFDPEPIRRVGRKIIKGLYYNHFGTPLAGKATVSLFLNEDIKMNQMLTFEDLTKDTVKYGQRCIIGNNNEFHYAFASTGEKFGTSWILNFNRAIGMIGITLPIKNIQQPA